MINRLYNSAVVWSWVFNGIRLVSGLVLLPLVLHELSTADLGMYYVLLSLVALAPIIDFGFGPTMGRFVSYAMGGAETLHAHGPPTPGKPEAPITICSGNCSTRPARSIVTWRWPFWSSWAFGEPGLWSCAFMRPLRY